MRTATPLFWLLVIIGLALSLWMALHSQVMPDQVNQLRFAWHVLEEDEWLPHGVPTSAGGKTPGGLIAIVTAIPLVLWADYRAVAPVHRPAQPGRVPRARACNPAGRGASRALAGAAYAVVEPVAHGLRLPTYGPRTTHSR